jgi:hypothetical protein
VRRKHFHRLSSRFHPLDSQDDDSKAELARRKGILLRQPCETLYFQSTIKFPSWRSVRLGPIEAEGDPCCEIRLSPKRLQH